MEQQDEDVIYNLDETHFIVDSDNGRALGLLGENTVNYAEVSNGTKGFTVVSLLRGSPNACIESTFIVFKNANESYLLLGVADDLHHASYRRRKNGGWIDVSFVLCCRNSAT